MSEFKLPSLGADMDEGKLLEWKVQPGDTVKRGQIVAVVDTSKAAVDVEIWQDGVIQELRVQPGETVPVGTVLATLVISGERAAAKATVRPELVEGRAALEPQGQRADQPERGGKEGTPQPSRAPISPAARKRAQELGVDVNTLRGSGAQGAITLADVEAAKVELGKTVRVEPFDSAQDRPVETRSMPADRQQAMRRAIAAAMSRSKREIPHYYLSETIPMARALAWLQQRNADLPVTERILLAVLQLKAVALAVKRVPQLNGFYRNDAFEPSAAVHTGVAIALRGGGLVAPALHDVATKPLAQLMRELADLVQRARAGSLRSSEMSDPTITVTNLGDQGVQAVFGVIYPPQVALVGFGSVAERPWVADGALRAVPLLTASLSADHRVTDGHQGALFLAALRELLQQPEMLAQTTDEKGGTA
jgi:pyruvate dehydrogenase E2 component (dihydrolipoamide acetyltransferase)